MHELGKHMAKLSVEDSEDSVVLLRPRYEMKPERMRSMIEGINSWRKNAHAKLRVLIVPHDFDVFALEVRDADGSALGAVVEEGGQDAQAPAQGDAGNAGDGSAPTPQG